LKNEFPPELGGKGGKIEYFEVEQEICEHGSQSWELKILPEFSTALTSILIVLDMLLFP
jgi:hypothetical protein